MPKQYLSYADYLHLFQQHGNTDQDYLYGHYQRFCQTQQLFYETWSLNQGHRLLDIGAHWLHQALLYAQDGFKVTAADFPITITDDSVKRLASAYQIELFAYRDLSNFHEFSQFPDNAFDVILFTEIIEHITFNPVALWKGLYRILSPQGRIIVTTPNYYYYQGRAWNLKRLFSRLGGGLPVDEILTINTYGHHWKEFSAREIKSYFTLLSPDFQVTRLQYVDFYPRENRHQRLISKLENRLSIFLKQNIYAEITLTAKDKGIIINPSWSPAGSSSNDCQDAKQDVDDQQQTKIQSPTKCDHQDLSIMVTFTSPRTVNWRLGPYPDNQGQYYALVLQDYLDELAKSFVKLPSQGSYTFAKPLSSPLRITVKYVATAGWETYSTPLVLDPKQVNI